MNKIYILMIITISLLLSCSKDEYSSPIFQKKYSANNFAEIAKQIENDKDISPENITYLSNGLKRLSFNKDSIDGKTIKDIILSEKEYVYQYTLSELKKISDISILRLNTENKFLGVVLAITPKKEEFNKLYFTLNNKYSKAIKNISGELLFFYRPDMNKPDQRQLNPIPFSYNSVLKANAIDTVILNQPFDKNNETSVLLRNNTSNLSGVMNILEVEFED